MTADVLNIESLTNASEAQWEDYVLRHPEATSYHRLFWKDIFCKTFGYEPFYLIARQGEKITGIMPLFKIPLLRGALMSSIPFRDRAPPLADDESSFQKLIAAAVAASREKRCSSLLIKSLEPLPPIDVAEGKFSCSKEWVRSYVTLPGSKEVYWKTINDKTRNMIRQAEAAALEFSRPALEDPKTGEAIDLLRATQHRLGIPPFPRSFYRDLLEALERHGAGELCVVTHENQITAAAILLFEADGVIYGYAGSDPKSWKWRVNDFLVWNCLGRAMQAGKSTFDFGSDSVRQENLLFFKKKWGAAQQPLHYYACRIGKDATARPFQWRDSSQGLYPALRNIVRRMPGPLYNLTGMLTRYFG